MTEEKKKKGTTDWKRDMREMLRGLVGATKGRDLNPYFKVLETRMLPLHQHPFGERAEVVRSREKELVARPPLRTSRRERAPCTPAEVVRSREKELVGPSESSRGMSGTEVGVEGEGVSVGAKLTELSSARLYDLEGQDLYGFGVGDLVELVPTTENRGMYPYLPVAGKVVGPNNRQEMFHLDGVKVGLVVRKGWKNTKKVFEESRSSNENNWQADELLRRLEERGVVHGRAELLEVLIGSEEVVVEVLGPSCDPRKSFMVRKLSEE